MIAILSIAGVHTFYGHIEALRGVDVEVKHGEIVTLIGANGAGKSTLLMTICGNPRAARGRIVFDGEDISAKPTHEIIRSGIAQAPEGRRIFPHMTVIENLLMGAITASPGTWRKIWKRFSPCFPSSRKGGNSAAAPYRGASSKCWP